MVSRGIENWVTIGGRNYKWCFVPQCLSTTVRTPRKVFLTVPRNETIKRKWFEAVRRKYEDVSPKSTFYACEDHFNMAEDMENWMAYTYKAVSNLRSKRNVVPHIFDCQNDDMDESQTEEPPPKYRLVKEDLSKTDNSGVKSKKKLTQGHWLLMLLVSK